MSRDLEDERKKELRSYCEYLYDAEEEREEAGDALLSLEKRHRGPDATKLLTLKDIKFSEANRKLLGELYDIVKEQKGEPTIVEFYENLISQLGEESNKDAKNEYLGDFSIKGIPGFFDLPGQP